MSQHIDKAVNFPFSHLSMSISGEISHYSVFGYNDKFVLKTEPARRVKGLEIQSIHRGERRI